MWKALSYAQSLRRIRGSDTCSGDGLHHAGQTVIILEPHDHRVLLGFAASTSLERRMPGPESCCPPSAINGPQERGRLEGPLYLFRIFGICAPAFYPCHCQDNNVRDSNQHVPYRDVCIDGSLSYVGSRYA